MVINVSPSRSRNRQLALNFISTLVGYILSLGISFFLTPYIVERLGTSAYGFIGLSSSIIGYAGLLTVALNSMSSRFITIKYHEGDFNEANRYLSSTFYANSAMGLFIVLLLGIGTLFLEYFINIPPELVNDVKFLFTLSFVNSSLCLCTGIYSIGTFIKNRLELSNIRGMVGNVLRTVLTIIAYGFFPAHLWYIGAIAIVCSIYIILTNYWYFKTLTPELNVSLLYFKFGHVWEMTKAGAWNLLTSLSSILNQGLDLLLANVFISAYYMGIMSLSKSVPWILLGVFASLANIMQPEYIKYYAEKRIDLLSASLVKSVRLLGLFTTVPCAILLAYGDIFYASWLPSQDYQEIYAVSCITMSGLLVTFPTQSLWYIFTMTNKVRISSLNLIAYGIVNVILVITAMYVFESDRTKLYAIVGIQATLMLIRFTTFLPFYGAKVLGLPKYTLLIPILKLMVSTIALTAISLLFKHLFIDSYSWATLFVGASFTAVIGIVFSYRLSLNATDREFVRKRFLHLKR